MIVLQKATTNEDLTFLKLKADSDLVNPYYLFVFTKGGNDYPVISADLATSSQKDAYSKFTIVEGVDDPENGSLIMGGVGVYDLVIYEQASSTNLDPDNASKVRETLTRVIDSETSTYIAHTITVSYTEHTVSI